MPRAALAAPGPCRHFHIQAALELPGTNRREGRPASLHGG